MIRKAQKEFSMHIDIVVADMVISVLTRREIYENNIKQQS